ncbi:MAG: hypothetical protein FWE54_01015 [Methanimicrococcus sp.]|nr:hypothetical protein [Methanimicrococcus sp.]
MWFISTPLVLFLYFLAGGKFLSKTDNLPANILSVSVLAIISLLFFILQLLHGSTEDIYGEIYTSVMTLLPFLMMFAGLMTKNQVNEFKKRAMMKINDHFSNFKKSFDERTTRVEERLPKTILILIKILLTLVKVVANNLITLIIQVCLYFVYIIPLLVIAMIMFSIEEIIDNVLSYLILLPFAIIYIIPAFFIYFLIGKKILFNTHYTLTNILSVIGLVYVLTAIGLSPDSLGWDYGNLPFYSLQLLLGEVTEGYIYFILTPLPSLIMLAGLLAKQKGYDLKELKMMIFFKNQVNKFKKRS